MVKIRNNLLLSGFVAVSIAASASEARAKVIVCDKDLRAQVGSAADSLAKLGLDFLVAGSESEKRAGAISTLFALESTGAPEKPAPERPPVEVKAIGVPAGMAPCSTSLSQVSGSGVGGALLRTAIQVSDQADLAGSLPAESRLLRPSGPKNRWFRPPRNWL